MLCTLVLAQAVDPISGGAGWIGAGLLGLVLGWLLLIYLPSKDKQLKEFLEAKDLHVQHITDKFVRSMEIKDQAAIEAAKSYKAAMDSVIKYWREEIDTVIRSRRQDMQAQVRALREQEGT